MTEWFRCKYFLTDGPAGPNSRRVVSMDRYTTQIYGEGGEWGEVEVDGNAAIVKVRASVLTLTQVQLDPDIQSLPGKAAARIAMTTIRKKPFYDEITQTVQFSDEDVLVPLTALDDLDARILNT